MVLKKSTSLFIIFLYHLYFTICFSTNNSLQEVHIESSPELNEKVKLKYPNIKTIVELSNSYESRSVMAHRAKKVVIAICLVTFLSIAGKYGFDLFFSNNKVNEGKINSGFVGASLETDTIDESMIKVAKNRFWSAKVENVQRKENVSYWFKRGLYNGVYFGFTSAIIGLILGIFSSTSSFSRGQISLFLEALSLRDTFLVLKEGLIYNLNWTSELLRDLSSSDFDVGNSFKSYSGLIDNNFVWVHAVESFFAIILARTKIKFGENSTQYKNIIGEEKRLLIKVEDFIKSMESDINLWNRLGYCDVSDKTFELLRIMTSCFLTFSNSAQFMLYGSSYKRRINTT